MGIVQSYRLRVKRRLLLLRALRKRRELRSCVDRTGGIRPRDILAFACLRNEAVRLPHFLKYYRDLGVDRFLIVDNASTDGTAAYLADQPDVSVWRTDSSYRDARFGLDWVTWLLCRYGHNHWCLTVDADELLVYPFCETRPLAALADWLDSAGIRSFPAMLLDMYPKGPVGAQALRAGEDPTRGADWFDPGTYVVTRNPLYRNLWIQGGPRMRAFFPTRPHQAPALNKIPLVRWNRRFAYVASTHMLLPRGLNLTYAVQGGERISGVLLHPKFTDDFAARATEELTRRQHYAGSAEYTAYARRSGDALNLWVPGSERYIDWRQLEVLGLMSRGNWA